MAGDYWVIDTDYDTFASVYSCANLGPIKFELAYILTREKNPPEETVLLQAAVILAPIYLLPNFHRFNWHWMPLRGMESLIYRGSTFPMLTIVSMKFLLVVMMITLVNKSQIIVSQLMYLFAFDLIVCIN